MFSMKLLYFPLLGSNSSSGSSLGALLCSERDQLGLSYSPKARCSLVRGTDIPCLPGGEAQRLGCPLHTCDYAIPKGNQMSLGSASCCHMLLIHVDINCSASSPSKGDTRLWAGGQEPRWQRRQGSKCNHFFTLSFSFLIFSSFSEV